MTSIIKNQIVKHLSAFARNLKPEQITMEVLRGKAHLRNLELNEDVLAEKLELPPWLTILSASCDRVRVNIPWRKLKSSPVELFVDEIRVAIRLAAPNTSTSTFSAKKPNTSSTQAAKTYDLAERVIETLSLYVQSLELFFESDSRAEVGFRGSIVLHNLSLESKPPHWKDLKEVDVNMTRIHDKTVRQVLFFKQLSWRLLRIEASAQLKDGNNENEQKEPRRSKTNSPLRLLTGDGKCRISIKKSSLDCSLIAGKIELILEEIHWIATMLHLRTAIDFYKHLLQIANAPGNCPTQLLGPQQNPFLAQQKSSTPSKLSAQVSAAAQANLPNSFQKLDILQSSHHLNIAKVDLLLLDDSESNMLPVDWHLDQGAMQAFLHRVRLDFYPQHKVFDLNGDFSPRSNWVRYPTPNSFTDLTKQQLNEHVRQSSSSLEGNQCERFMRIWPQLASQNVVLRIENIILQRVTQQSTKKDALQEMFCMDKRTKERLLPETVSFFHLEVASYFFPASSGYPVPADSVHLVVAPLELSPDTMSIRWLVYALESIVNTFESPTCASSPPVNSAQATANIPKIRMELFMPKIVLSPGSTAPPSPSHASTSSQPAADHRLPKRFIVQASTILFANFVLREDPALVPLPAMFSEKASFDKQLHFIEWAERHSVDANLREEFTRKRKAPQSGDAGDSVRNEWFLSIPSIWVNCDFGASTWELPLLSDLKVFGSVVLNGTDPTQPGNCIFVEPKTDIGVALDHFQFVQLTQMMNEVSTLSDQISTDRMFFHKIVPQSNDDLPTAIYCHCERIHLRLILPTGPAPSPYDPKWTGANDVVSPSNEPSSMSSSGDLRDEDESPTKRGEPTTPVAETTTLICSEESAVLCSGMKTVHSIGEFSNASSTGRFHSEQANKKHLLGGAAFNFPDFPGTPSDLESNIDTMSVTTSTSAEQIIFDGTTTTEDDVFGPIDDAVEEAEEVAGESIRDIDLLRRRDKLLSREVNVFDVLLEDLNVYMGAIGGKTTALGFASNIHVGERLRKNCGEIYAEKGATYEALDLEPAANMDGVGRADTTDNPTGAENPNRDAKLKLEVRSAPRQSAIKVDLSGMDICLSDEVVSQLSPFIQNPTEDEYPPALELSLQRCRVQIKDPKKKFPLRIRLGELNIEDGPVEREARK